MPFVRVYFSETQELVFDAHDKAFQFYGGVCRRGIYDSWRDERVRVPVHAYVPMSFAPGEAYQFDWSHETITLQNLPLLPVAEAWLPSPESPSAPRPIRRVCAQAELHART